MSFFGEHDAIYKIVWKRRIHIVFHKDQINLQKQINLKVDVGNDSYSVRGKTDCKIDQNRWEILEQSMRYSFLVKFQGFSLHLYYQSNSFAGIVLVFFVLLFQETPILGNIFWWSFHLMLIVKHLKCRENLKTTKQIKKSKVHSVASNNLSVCLEKRCERPWEHKCDVLILFLSLFQKYLS